MMAMATGTGVAPGILMVGLACSRSRIVQANGGVLYARRYPGLAGRFRKDREESRIYGRALCDLVRQEFCCHGFFTTDELPRYGITRAETRHIFEAAGASEKDLVVLYAYPRALAEGIDRYLAAYLAEKR